MSDAPSAFQPAIAGPLSGLVRRPTAPLQGPVPLVVAVHGGTYSARYFDLPGASTLALAAEQGMPALAINRPGYAGSPALAPAEMTVRGQARFLREALADAWARHGAGTRGLFLIGHSIGAAIVATLAADLATEPGQGTAALPLLGIALSGMCMHTPAEHKTMWESLPDTPTVEIPAPVKASLMFGPPGSHDPAMVALSAAADAPAPKAELVDIVSTWNGNAVDTLGRIAVPVHYRQSALDPLWIMSADEVAQFQRALVRSPHVDAALVQATGHCMELHHYGRALRLQQLGFALACAHAA